MREAREPLVVVIFKVTAQEQKLIERHAKKAGMTVPDYVRPRCISTWSWRATRRPSAWWGGKLRNRLAEKPHSMRLTRAVED